MFSQQKAYMNMKRNRELREAQRKALNPILKVTEVVPTEKPVIEKPVIVKPKPIGPTIAWGMRVAPRKISTIEKTIASFRKVFGDQHINLYMEPYDSPMSAYTFDLEKLWNVTCHRNQKRLGDVGNYHNALQNLFQWTDSDYIAVLEDDWLFADSAKDVLYKLLNKLQWGFWYASFSTDSCSGLYINKTWWNDVSINGDNRVGRWLTGNMFIFPRDVVRQILDHPFYTNHVLWYKRWNASDCMIAETVKQLGYKTLYHNPSLVSHIGNVSTLGHDENNATVYAGKWFFSKNAVDKVVVWIATIPEREMFLEKTIASLIDQVDEINVGLNNYKYVPEYLLNNPKIRPVLLDNKRWDAAKYFFVHEYQWYYFTCDDDLAYPPDYVSTMIKRINKLWKDKCIVSVHWHHFKKLMGNVDVHRDMQHYYYFNDLISDVAIPAHIIGTGVAAYHTDALLLHYQDFAEPNKADEQMAVITRIQWVQPYIIPHKWNRVTNLDPNEDTPALWRKTNWERRLHRYQRNLFPILRIWK